jgi:hypothetical protein
MAYCAAANNCPGQKPMDCAQACSDGGSVAVASGCTDQFNASLACYGKQSDICSAMASSTVCQAENTAWDRCTAPYCTSHQPTQGC